VGRFGEAIDPGGVDEVLGVEADHVGPGHPEAFAAGVDQPHLGLAGGRLAQVVERDRHHPAALDADHRPAAPFDQEADRALPQVAAVLRVERNGIGAAQLVADVLVGDGDVEAALGEPALDFGLHLASEVDLGEADVPVVVPLDVGEAGQLARIELVDHALGEDGDAEVAAHRPPLDDRALDDVADLGEGHDVLRELLGDHGEGGAGGLADAQRQVAGLAAHGHHDVPAPRRARVLHQVPHQLGADVAGRLEAEGGYVGRQGQIVVDRLRDVDAPDGALRTLGNRPRRERGIVPPDGHEVRHTGLLQRVHDRLERLG
jgi:hypothetical protein